MTGHEDPKLLAAVREALVQGKPSEAVQIFLEAQQKGGLPRGEGLMGWVTTTLGPDLAKTLVSAFVHEPCMFCAKGLVSCERCEGKGHSDYTFVCEECFSLGLRPCRFCNAMSWASLDFAP